LKAPKGFCGTFVGELSAACKQDLPKKVGVAAHAVISKKNPWIDWIEWKDAVYVSTGLDDTQPLDDSIVA
jgi:hypothetical protein